MTARREEEGRRRTSVATEEDVDFKLTNEEAAKVELMRRYIDQIVLAKYSSEPPPPSAPVPLVWTTAFCPSQSSPPPPPKGSTGLRRRSRRTESCVRTRSSSCARSGTPFLNPTTSRTSSTSDPPPLTFCCDVCGLSGKGVDEIASLARRVVPPPPFHALSIPPPP
jgi:hypothetical protein